MDQASLVNSGVVGIRVRHFDFGGGQSGGGKWVSPHGPRGALGRYSRVGFVFVLETANVVMEVGYDFVPSIEPVSSDFILRDRQLDELVQLDAI